MNFSFQNTVCLYSCNEKVAREVSAFCKRHSFKLFNAKEGADLVAAPYFLAVIDGSKLNSVFLDYLEEFAGEKKIEEIIISLIVGAKFIQVIYQSKKRNDS